jgi:PTS system mannose-specific IIB component
MPVVHLRVDNRLIHGQVTVVWVSRLRADHLVVANDEVAADELQRLLLPQAARGVPTVVLPVRAAAAFCTGAADRRLFVVAKHPGDALRLVQAGVRVAEVNVANAAPAPGATVTRLTRTVAVTAADADDCRALATAGVRVVSQLMPTDRPADLLALLARKGPPPGPSPQRVGDTRW